MPVASFETEPEVAAPLADLHLGSRNLADIDSARPQPHPSEQAEVTVTSGKGKEPEEVAGSAISPLPRGSAHKLPW